MHESLIRRAFVLAAALLLAAGVAGAQAPSTDIWLLTLEETGDGLEPAAPRNVTDRDGYDNQPSFTAAGDLLYTSQRDGQTDIYRLAADAADAVAVTSTPESEYSPTPMPGGSTLSVVRDYGELVQQLWSFPLGGDGEPELLVSDDLGPIGYHAWIDGERLILFVLGEPLTLQLAEIGATEGQVLAENPGRALAKFPGSDEMSFVLKVSPHEWWVAAVDPESGETRRLVRTRPGREDCAWGPGGALWQGDGSRLYTWRPGETEWTLAADLAEHGIAGITRLAFDPSGERLALVAERAAE